ncbi:MAG: ribonuclease HII [Firmicutes bacterium]|nr:ribonuclease HII [[Eubacterium] siraeum]MCM1487473.1 ribonuclease HII [Bacillota bacterium]
MERSLLKHRQCEERFNFDRQKRSQCGVICGIDEAGRGPWIGDVYAAAVVFDDGVFIEGLDDSKKLSEAKREALFEEITQKASAYCVAFATVEEIETLNILQATFLAMERACEGLKISPALALVDGNRTPPLPFAAQTVVKGDSASASIAAASILAKVSRDRKMRELDSLYPEFNFKSNKGYGTAQHISALKEFGYTPVHRRSFLVKQEKKQGAPFKKYEEQQAG